MTDESGAGAPLVSVILPARRPDAGHFAAAVSSVLSQTHRRLELILVDDGLGSALLPADSRMIVVKNRGSGLVDALNTGLGLARGPLIARMDADDISHPMRFELQAQAILRLGLDIAGTGVEVFGREGRGEGYRLYEEWMNSLVDPADILREIFVESPLAHPSVMMKTETVKSLGGYRDMGWPEDYDLWLRAMEAGCVIGKTPQILLRWRDEAGRTSRTDPRYSKESFLRAKAHFLARTALKGKKAVIWGAGKTGRLLAKCLELEGADIRAFIDISPARIGGSKAGKPVLPPSQALRGRDDELVIGAVSARGARDVIRSRLNAMGGVEGRDYLMAA